MNRVFAISPLNIISILLIIALMVYRKRVMKELRKLAGSGRLNEIKTLELRKEYCLLWTSVILIINLMARLMYLD